MDAVKKMAEIAIGASTGSLTEYEVFFSLRRAGYETATICQNMDEILSCAKIITSRYL